MKYKVIVYYDNMPDSEHIFSNKNDAINELHRSWPTVVSALHITTHQH